MKRFLAMLLMLSAAGAMSAQGPEMSPRNSGSHHQKKANKKYEILVRNESNMKAVQETNSQIQAFQASSRQAAQRASLGDMIWDGLTSSFEQKTVNATSNLVSLGLNYLTEALKNKREMWYRKAKQQCYYNQLLSAETKIDDFYSLPSVKGAMDPENLRFEGFGCKSYIEVKDRPGEGVGVLYLFCKIRRDEVGIQHIVNHSKFLVELDTLIFNPKYCNLPNDSTGSADSRFSFEKRDSLNLQLKARFYSSWMNQATLIMSDQLLGEFVINVKVDKRKLNSDSLFVYDKNDPDFKKLVSIDGDCFIVPRSYTGTLNGKDYIPSWGTGQYRVEMEISERCEIVDSYYQIRESGNGEAVAFSDATPGKKKWDKAKWKVEWKAMNKRPKNSSFFKNALDCVVSAYKGSGWVATFTDPVTTALYSWETMKLKEWIGNSSEQKESNAKTEQPRPSKNDDSQLQRMR